MNKEILRGIMSDTVKKLNDYEKNKLATLMERLLGGYEYLFKSPKDKVNEICNY